MATNTNTRLVTPQGIAEYPHIEEPDTKFDEEGLYHVNLILDKEQASPIVETMSQILNTFIATDTKVKEAKSRGKQFIIQDFFEDLDGDDIRLKFKQKATYTRKSDGKIIQVKIPVFDSKGVPVQDTKIGGGSTIRVCFTANPYYMPATKSVGLSLRLVAVKLIELKEWGSNTAEAYGFGEEEEGYQATKKEEAVVEPKKEVNSFDDLEEDAPNADF